MPRRKPTPVATRHGATQPEEERANVQLLLRLPPEIAATLRARAAAEEMTIAGYVVRLVRQDAQIR